MSRVLRRRLKTWFPGFVAFVLALGVGLTIWTNTLGSGIALVVMAGVLGYSAALIALIYRGWPEHQNATAIARNAATTAVSAQWFDRVLTPRIPLPRMSGWALEPDTAGFLVQLILQEKPNTVVEIGSGVSTLLIAYALEKNGKGHLVSYDTEKEFANRTVGLLAAHGLSHRARVKHAAFAPLRLADWDGLWLSTAAFEELGPDSVDLFLVDGPPRPTTKMARYPALPVLHGKLKANAIVLADDTEREEEQAMLRRWRDERLIGDNYQCYPIGTGVTLIRGIINPPTLKDDG